MLIAVEKIYTWADTNSSHRNVIEGHRVLNANHLIKIGKNIENVSAVEVSLTALCLQTSHLRESPHEISGTLRHDGEIISFKCSCKAGLSEKCKHIIAVLLYCSRHDFETFEVLSCTDQSCKWKKVLHQQALTQYVSNPLEQHECYRTPPKKYKLDDKYLTILQNKILHELPNSAVTKRTIGRHSPVVFQGEKEQLTDIEREAIRVIFEEPESLIMIRLAEVKMDDLLPCCKQTLAKLNGNFRKICEDTKIFYATWHEERRCRVTGSTCYGLFTYTRNKNPNWKKKCQDHINPRSFKTEFTEYGKAMEGKARELFSKNYKEQVIETGLIISKSNPWLAYSPDGVIFRNGKPYKLLEIKCLKTGKTMTAQEVVNGEIGKSVIRNKNSNVIQLKQKQKYYGQVQLGMAILNLKETAFVYYADYDKTVAVINVQLDPTFVMKMLLSLKVMYFKFMVHEICTIKNDIDKENADGNNNTG